MADVVETEGVTCQDADALEEFGEREMTAIRLGGKKVSRVTLRICRVEVVAMGVVKS